MGLTIRIFLCYFLLTFSVCAESQPPNTNEEAPLVDIPEEVTENVEELFSETQEFLGIKDTDVDSCIELHQQLKDSDCYELANSFLTGTSLMMGAALKKATPAIINKKTQGVALFSGYFVPSLYYTIMFPSQYFGESNFGYNFAFGYQDFFSFSQLILRDIKEQAKNINSVEVDLNTYITGQMLFFTPRLFYDYGARDETPDKYFSIGIGTGVGVTALKGNAYLTESIRKRNEECHAAGIQLVSKSVPRTEALEQIKEHCEYTEFDATWGTLSGSAFMGWRWGNFYLNGEFNGMFIDTRRHLYVPSMLSAVLAYVVQL